MKRFTLAVVLTCVVFPAGALSKAVDSPSKIPAEIKALDLDPASCAADPFASKCPKVNVVNYPDSLDASKTEGSIALYGPVVEGGIRSRRRGVHKSGHGTGTVCGVYASVPEIIFVDTHRARGTGTNHCLSGQGVTYHEVTTHLQREDGFGGWTTLAGAFSSMYAAGVVQATARYDCNHTRYLQYRTEALGYSVVRGVGYFGVNRKGAGHTCPS